MKVYLVYSLYDNCEEDDYDYRCKTMLHKAFLSMESADKWIESEGFEYAKNELESMAPTHYGPLLPVYECQKQDLVYYTQNFLYFQDAYKLWCIDVRSEYIDDPLCVGICGFYIKELQVEE